MRKLVSLGLLVLVAGMSRADDGAASIAAGGIVLMKREPRIVMAREILKLSEHKVIVDYDFRNDSDIPITTMVAFPVPPYTYEDDVEANGDARFDDFQLTIDGSPKKFSIETRAFVGKRDITAVLSKLGIDAASFGHMKRTDLYDGPFPDIERVTPAARAQLVALGAVKGGDPNWRVEKKYYWSQTFPARGTVHIRHEYTPVIGASNTTGDPSITRGKDAMPEYASVCPDLQLQQKLKTYWNVDLNKIEIAPTEISYVDFILTTANTWKTPIEDFTLIVERPKAWNRATLHHQSYVSFCWDGPVQHTDPDHFEMHQTNLIPTKELRIGFIDAISEIRAAN